MKIPPAIKPFIAELRRLRKEQKKHEVLMSKVEAKVEKLEDEYRKHKNNQVAAFRCIESHRNTIIEKMLEAGVDSEAVLEYMEKL